MILVGQKNLLPPNLQKARSHIKIFTKFLRGVLRETVM